MRFLRSPAASLEGWIAARSTGRARIGRPSPPMNALSFLEPLSLVRTPGLMTRLDARRWLVGIYRPMCSSFNNSIVLAPPIRTRAIQLTTAIHLTTGRSNSTWPYPFSTQFDLSMTDSSFAPAGCAGSPPGEGGFPHRPACSLPLGPMRPGSHSGRFSRGARPAASASQCKIELVMDAPLPVAGLVDSFGGIRTPLLVEKISRRPNPHRADCEPSRSLQRRLGRGSEWLRPVMSRVPQLTKAWEFRCVVRFNATVGRPCQCPGGRQRRSQRER